MQSYIGKFITAIAVLAILSGCSSIPQQSFDKDKNQHIKTIALLDIPEPQEYLAFNIGGVGSAFGLIGGLIEGQNAASNSELLTSELQKSKVDIGDHLQKELANRLEAAGYNVIVLNDVRPEYGKPNQPDYSQINTEADAILDVQHVVSGFISPMGSSDYKLWVRVLVHMVATENKETIYHQLFNYGEELSRLDEIVYFEEVQPKAYPDFDSLINNIPALKESLQGSSPVISAGIASQL